MTTSPRQLGLRLFSDTDRWESAMKPWSAEINAPMEPESSSRLYRAGRAGYQPITIDTQNGHADSTDAAQSLSIGEIRTGGIIPEVVRVQIRLIFENISFIRVQ